MADTTDSNARPVCDIPTPTTLAEAQALAAALERSGFFNAAEAFPPPKWGRKENGYEEDAWRDEVLMEASNADGDGPYKVSVKIEVESATPSEAVAEFKKRLAAGAALVAAWE